MYNGIGLDTARGSGTNGYVQRNVAFIKHQKDRVDYKSEEELKKLEAQVNKGPNKEILAHERKRKVELKCIEMQELMEEQGYTAEEIERKVSTFRKMLMDKEGVTERAIETDEAGRPVARDTHATAEANLAKNDAMKAALGISDYFKDGSSFDPERHAKEEQARAVAMAQKQYGIVRDSSESRSPTPEKKSKKKKKKTSSSKRSRSDSESSDHHRSHDKKKKKKKKRKHRHDDSHSETDSSVAEKSQDENDNTRKKKKKRKRKRSMGRSDQSGAGSGSDGSDEALSSDTDITDSEHSDSTELDSEEDSTDSSEENSSSDEEEEDESDEEDDKQHEKSQICKQRNSSKERVTAGIDKTAAQQSALKDNKSNLPSAVPKNDKKDGGDKFSGKRRSKRGHHHKHSRRSESSSHRARHKSAKSSRKRHYSSSESRSRSHSRSFTRSPSIRRRKGSPSHLDRRRITSARKRPVPYARPSPEDSDSDWSRSSTPSTRYYPSSPPPQTLAREHRHHYHHHYSPVTTLYPQHTRGRYRGGGMNGRRRDS